MFIGDYEQDAAWSIDSLRGCRRFLEKVIRLKDKVVDGEEYSKEAESLIHKTIKKVSYDLVHMAYNTAVSSLMILANKYDDMDKITKADYRVLLILLNPLAPHITEELNEDLGFTPIVDAEWPEYSEEKTVDKEKMIGVQVNGKLRGEINISVDDNEDVIKDRAFQNENVKKFMEGKEIVKVIVIPNKIVNIVVK